MNINEHDMQPAVTLEINVITLTKKGEKSRFRCIPVCVRMCPLSSHGLEKAFPQVGHTQGRVCERMCIFRAPRLVYSLGQCLQWKAGRAETSVGREGVCCI